MLRQDEGALARFSSRLVTCYSPIMYVPLRVRKSQSLCWEAGPRGPTTIFVRISVPYVRPGPTKPL